MMIDDNAHDNMIADMMTDVVIDASRYKEWTTIDIICPDCGKKGYYEVRVENSHATKYIPCPDCVLASMTNMFAEDDDDDDR